MIFGAADQIAAPHGFQCIAQHGPVFRVVVTKEGFVQLSLAACFRYLNRFAMARNSFQRVFAGVIHGRCSGHR